MPEAVLQDYLQEISSLIDDSHLDEAVRHCRHILKQYPRHVETYRLLGKALLEQEKLEDAADIFHRVLSADPEDFIAHAGLAIIHKHKNQLQDATWHMERAFEVEPYNAAVRESLEDLIGRRDGLPPEELTLTPGALARIYVRGELYSQAISDLRQLLSEEPDRVELHVLLAEALWRDGQRIDAAEECTRILQQLPNCVKVNAILGEVCLVTDRIDEAQGYLRQVFELVLPTTGSLGHDTAVGIAFRTGHSPVLPEEIPVERAVAEDEARVIGGEADWVKDLDLGEEFALEDTQPEWLGALQDESGTSDVEVEELDSASKSAATVDASDQGDGAATSYFSRTTDQLPVIGGLREETDWDGWLEVEREPVEAFEASSPGDGSQFEEVGMDMMDHQGNNEDEFPEAEDSKQPDAEASRGGEESPDWLDELQEASGPTQASEFESMDDDDLPDWLREGIEVDDMEGDLDWLDEAQESDAPVEVTATDTREQVPDWLGEELPLEGEDLADAGDDLSWLDEIAAGQGDPLEEPPTMSWPEDDTEGSEAFDSLEVGAAPASEQPPTSAEADTGAVGRHLDEGDEDLFAGYSEDDVPEDLDDAMAWLEQLAAQQGAPAEELPSLSATADSAEEAELDEAPEDLAGAMDWLDELALSEHDAELDIEDQDISVAGAELADREPEGLPPDETSEDVDEAMAWLEQLATEGSGGDEMAFESVGEETDLEALADLGELPDDPELALAWLEGLADQSEQEDVAEGEVVEEQATPPVPLDVVAARAEAEAILLHDEEPSDLDSAQEDVEMVEEIPDDPDEAMAWLEKLAARQGASLDELPSLRDADEEVEPPDWLAEELAIVEEDDVFYSEAVEETDDTLYEANVSSVVDEGEAEVLEQEESEPLAEETPEAMDGDEEVDVLAGIQLGDESLEEELPDWLSLEDEGELEEFDWEEEPAFDASDWLQDDDVGGVQMEDEAFIAEDEPLEVDASIEEVTEAQVDTDVEQAVQEFAEPETEEPEAVAPFDEAPDASAEVADVEPIVAAEEETERIEEAEAVVAEPRLAEPRKAADPEEARQALESEQWDVALERYQTLLESSDVDVAAIIADLEQASAAIENQPGLLGLLGDAYNRNGQLQKALDVYRQALEML